MTNIPEYFNEDGYILLAGAIIKSALKEYEFDMNNLLSSFVRRNSLLPLREVLIKWESTRNENIKNFFGETLPSTMQFLYTEYASSLLLKSNGDAIMLMKDKIMIKEIYKSIHRKKRRV